jgi:hypothetical protein
LDILEDEEEERRGKVKEEIEKGEALAEHLSLVFSL